MMLDDDGTIWLSEYVGYEMGFHLRPTRWTAVNDEGNPTRVLELPPDFDLMQLTGGAVLGIQENEDGSLAVQVRAIKRS
jgi:SLT domain-containing protein